MIIIEDKIVADEILHAYFHCDLALCKGQCCVEGVCGAPLDEEEKENINQHFSVIKKYLSQDSLREIETQGKYVYYAGQLVTPIIGIGGICVYAYKDKNGVVKCAFERAFLNKEITWKKPISCHLFPIRILKTHLNEQLNYEKISICKHACQKGERQKTKMYEFLKEPLIRKYGNNFFDTLKEIDEKYFS